MRTGRKISGGKYHASRKKRHYEKKSQGNMVVLGDVKRKKIRARSGDHKTVLLRSNIANLSEKGKTKKVEIKNVIETPQDRFLARQNKLMKGAIIETSAGKARITNRPSREGFINVVLVK